MAEKDADTIVVGLGAVGSAAVYQLAKRGQRVLGIDQFSPPHDYGSSHGKTRIIRQAMFWFKFREEADKQFLPGKFPIFIWVFGDAETNVFYGFPSLDGKTIKIASEQYANVTTPEDADREITAAEKNTMYQNYVRGWLPDITNVCDEAASCLFTTTPDFNFVIDSIPGQPQVLIASACSGHGFKHSAAVGEILAELVLEGRSRIDISRSLSIGLTRPLYRRTQG